MSPRTIQYSLAPTTAGRELEKNVEGWSTCHATTIGWPTPTLGDRNSTPLLPRTDQLVEARLTRCCVKPAGAAKSVMTVLPDEMP